MIKKILPFFIIVLLLFSCFLVYPVSSSNIQTSSTGNILYVGGSGPGNYSKIQDAIDNASDNDTVFVYNGTYYEKNVLIEKSIHLVGENKNNTVIDAEKKGNVLLLGKNDIEVSNFTIKNGFDGGSGILLTYGSNYYIYNNHLDSNYYGISIVGSDNNIISNNTISSNDVGIFISSSATYNLIKDNEIKSNNKGIEIISPKNTISRNTIIENHKGIYISSGENIIYYNLLMNNIVGMFFSMSPEHNNISYNHFSENTKYGIESEFPPDPTWYNLHHSFYRNNFLDEENRYLCDNRGGWNNNYWCNWKGLDYADYGESLISLINQLYEKPFLSKIIDFILEKKGYPSPPYSGPFYKIPGAPEYLPSRFNTYYNIDRNPASEPYDIDIGWEL